MLRLAAAWVALVAVIVGAGPLLLGAYGLYAHGILGGLVIGVVWAASFWSLAGFALGSARAQRVYAMRLSQLEEAVFVSNRQESS